MNDVEATISYGNENISFILRRTSRRKTISLSVGFDGLQVLAPEDMDDNEVMQHVRRKGPWILKKRASYSELTEERSKREFVGGECFFYLGRQYRLKIEQQRERFETTISARGRNLVAATPVRHSITVQRDAVSRALAAWYTEKARLRIPARIRPICFSLGIEEPIVKIVDQSKRWGSCDKQGVVRVNWRIIMAPTHLIDYVLAHEACHILEYNHSHRFWRSLSTIMPDYQIRVARLNEIGHRFIW
ncbi:SprT family zinc-dependent metalloprotease [Sulfitobacter pontiacus]|uniref:M48 family metallopeptidase n=1 Tax=Sulfitobacter pontiacus TaxID=60137 RepID=UPI0009EE6F61